MEEILFLISLATTLKVIKEANYKKTGLIVNKFIIDSFCIDELFSGENNYKCFAGCLVFRSNDFRNFYYFAFFLLSSFVTDIVICPYSVNATRIHSCRSVCFLPLVSINWILLIASGDTSVFFFKSIVDPTNSGLKKNVVTIKISIYVHIEVQNHFFRIVGMIKQSDYYLFKNTKLVRAVYRIILYLWKTLNNHIKIKADYKSNEGVDLTSMYPNSCILQKLRDEPGVLLFQCNSNDNFSYFLECYPIVKIIVFTLAFILCDMAKKKSRRRNGYLKYMFLRW
ncbi:hypothetical protein EGR_02197 [Echinococcus granulosus]|uniref:Uncharacterized protein n=1 Tax=Echinococcus granulosus TaxID=6210 RepID=W6UX51_ECHGR|nr:hypothetical protein EGR_02196 [Echinococcus granulosus]XP_024354299.1 hypothetical protein EGR_02197 [Echinococcus granulosus]EUB63102.1 hypothetical protein EGR_02196 [Echinococcus granulosus]EUB63103.1 hypothetical protein EGR_02197 [Echinococcus granulosus]